MTGDGDADGGERDGGSGTEETGEALGAEHFSQYGEKADDDATDQEAGEKFSNLNMHGDQSSRGSLRLLDDAHGGGGFLAAEEGVFLAFKAVVVDEELFELAQEFFRQV